MEMLEPVECCGQGRAEFDGYGLSRGDGLALVCLAWVVALVVFAAGAVFGYALARASSAATSEIEAETEK